MCTQANDKMSESVEKSVWFDVTGDVHSPESGNEELAEGKQISIAATPRLDWDAPLPLLYFPLENSSECRGGAFGRGRDLNFPSRLCSGGRSVPRHGLASRPPPLWLCQNALGELALISIFIRTLSKPLRETQSNQWCLGEAAPPPPTPHTPTPNSTSTRAPRSLIVPRVMQIATVGTNRRSREGGGQLEGTCWRQSAPPPPPACHSWTR